MSLKPSEKEAVDRFLSGLRKLRRAYEKLSQGTPTLQEALRSYNLCFETLQAALEDPDLERVLDYLIQEAHRQSESTPSGSAETSARGAWETEVRLSSRFGFRREEAQELIMLSSEVQSEVTNRVRTTREFRHRFILLHRASVAQLDESREQPRREKKRRKRKVAQGVTSSIFGLGLFVVDSQFPQLASVSYGLGLAAIHQATRDLVGEEDSG